MLDKIRAMPAAVVASMAFLLATLVAATIIEPVLMGGVIFVLLLFFSIGRVIKYLLEGR